MHTTVHAPQTKDHALIFGPKNQRVIILSGHDPNRAADVETPICMRSGWKYIDVAENEESLEPEDRRQRPRAGSVELSPTGREWNARGFAYSNPDCNVYLWSCAGGDSIPLRAGRIHQSTLAPGTGITGRLSHN